MIHLAEGQVYRATKDWDIFGVSFREGDIFSVLGFHVHASSTYGGYIVTTSNDTQDGALSVNRDGEMRWTYEYFESCVDDGLLELMPNAQLTDHPSCYGCHGLTCSDCDVTNEPKNNGRNEICHWCRQPTVPMFGTLRVCRSCNK